jgi:hypothetical protein
MMRPRTDPTLQSGDGVGLVAGLVPFGNGRGLATETPAFDCADTYVRCALTQRCIVGH